MPESTALPRLEQKTHESETAAAGGHALKAGIDYDPDYLRRLFSGDSKRQRWLDVEAALAQAEADTGIVPRDAAERITACARLELLDRDRIAEEESVTGHIMVPLVSELARVAGPQHGGWVHWGATTQNIQQSGDTVGVRDAHRHLRTLMCAAIERLGTLAEEHAGDLMAGRTHLQHAVPITLGFKVAAWADVMIRHLERFTEMEPRLFVSMTGGAVGTFATLGERGPAVQDGVARILGLRAMAVPSRNIVDHFAEFVCTLGMISATTASIAEEIARLMATEFGELSEPVPAGDVGSSTMPQKRNPKLCESIITSAAQVRALVPLALEAMIQSHEVDGSRSAMMDRALEQAAIFAGDALGTLVKVLTGLEVFPERMRANLDLTGGLITAEAVMMRLGELIGRQEAHAVVHHAAKNASTDHSAFMEVLATDSRITGHLTVAEIQTLLDPARHVGLSAEIAHAVARRARSAVALRP
jgi:3-carboxy-cis,cis-muconate cycloisomerase